LIVELTDDMDGSVIADGIGEPIEFSVHGVDYAIDLRGSTLRSSGRRSLLHDHAAKVGGRMRGGHPSAVRAAVPGPPPRSLRNVVGSERGQSGKVNSNRCGVSDRGQIPASVVEAFAAAH
jgi:hypothetical protein